jgi:rRNA maturation protein Nop10
MEVSLKSDSEKLVLVLEELVQRTGQCGPFLIGTMVCYLCGYQTHQIHPAKPCAAPINGLKFRCDRCGQKTLKFLDLNGDFDD